MLKSGHLPAIITPTSWHIGFTFECNTESTWWQYDNSNLGEKSVKICQKRRLNTPVVNSTCYATQMKQAEDLSSHWFKNNVMTDWNLLAFLPLSGVKLVYIQESLMGWGSWYTTQYKLADGFHVISLRMTPKVRTGEQGSKLTGDMCDPSADPGGVLWNG